MNNKKILNLVMASMFAALICVVTMFPHIPTPATNGYIHMGDAFILVAVWLLGPLYGSLAAGIGSALADLLSGYPHYVPGTFVIKLVVALIAYFSFVAFRRIISNKSFCFVASAFLGELFMIFGYFAYSSFLLGNGVAAAISSVLPNFAQATFAVLASVVIIRLLLLNKSVVKFFPNLTGFEDNKK